MMKLAKLLPLLLILGAALPSPGSPVAPGHAQAPHLHQEAQDGAPAEASQHRTADPSVTNAWCPVLPDERVDPEIYTEHQGRRVYFCCQRCLRMFEADPDAFASVPDAEVGRGGEAGMAAEPRDQHDPGASHEHGEEPEGVVQQHQHDHTGAEG